MTELTSEQSILTEKPSDPTQRIVLVVCGLLILGMIAVFAWKMYDGALVLVIDGPAPDFTLPLFEGSDITLSDLEGQVVVVNFWASWCIPCRDEAPFLEQAWRKYRDQDVVFLGVDYLDTDKEAQAFLAEFGVSYPNGPDIGTKIAKQYRLTGVPETFFIAKDGRLGDMEIGPLTEERLVQAIEKLLAE
ncbi:MAG: TlpA family protein disulfide reductase [Anaerolineae bacterium]|nr:TlpA family protein disulfide reductase [Anaerolineae bacterium]